MYDKYSREEGEKQILSDKDSKGKERPWREKKLKSLELAKSYKRVGYTNKWIRVKECGCQLVFEVEKETGKKKIKKANLCRVRLCSMCSWRRTVKIFKQASKVMGKALENKDYRFVFLTLTCKGVYGEELKKAIDSLLKGFDRLNKRRTIKKAVKGWFRALEITHDVEEYITHDMWYGNSAKHIKPRQEYYETLGLETGDKNPNFDKYKPHFHVIMMVNKDYFKDSGLYMTQEDWTEAWKECLDVSYTPIVDVRAFKVASKAQTAKLVAEATKAQTAKSVAEAAKAQIAKSVAEAAKYTVKDSDYLIAHDKELTDKTVMTLDRAMANRRLVAYGGELKKIHKQLNLDDRKKRKQEKTEETGDEEMREDVNYVIEHYRWYVGYKQYLRYYPDR